MYTANFLQLKLKAIILIPVKEFMGAYVTCILHLRELSNLIDFPACRPKVKTKKEKDSLRKSKLIRYIPQSNVLRLIMRVHVTLQVKLKHLHFMSQFLKHEVLFILGFISINKMLELLVTPHNCTHAGILSKLIIRAFSSNG